MTRPLTALSRFAAALAGLLGAFAWVLGALSSIACDPPHGMGLGGGKDDDLGGGGAAESAVNAPDPLEGRRARHRNLKLPSIGLLTRLRLIRWLLGSKKRLTLIGVVAVALAAGIGVFAYWLASGTGNASAERRHSERIDDHNCDRWLWYGDLAVVCGNAASRRQCVCHVLRDSRWRPPKCGMP